MQKTEKPFIIPIFIPHAGCPHRCVFCDQAAITSEKETLLTAGTLEARVSAHLKFRSKDRKPVQLAFYGGNFLGQKTAAILALLAEAAISPDFVRIYPTVVLAGSPLARLYQKGAYTPLSLKEAVALTKNLYLLFAKKNIPVIRMGLQATEDLDESAEVLTRPYHPAFGHLVYGELFLDRTRAMLAGVGGLTDAITLRVHSRSRSRLQGMRNQNIKALKNEFKLNSIQILSDDSLAADEVGLA